MDEIKKNFLNGYKKGKPQLIKKNLIADIETPFSSLLKIMLPPSPPSPPSGPPLGTYFSRLPLMHPFPPFPLIMLIVA